MLTSDHQPVAATNLPRFPPEITDCIIAEAEFPTMRACSLVCRDWVPATRHRLHRTLVVHGRKIPSFISLISSPYNTYRSTLREIDLGFSQDPQFPDLLSQLVNCVNLETLAIRSIVIFTHPLTHLGTVTSLQLVDAHFWSFETFTGILAQCPALRDLKLIDIGYGPEDDSSESGPSGSAAPPRRLVLNSLTMEISRHPRFIRWLTSQNSSPITSSLALTTSSRDEGTMNSLSQYLRLLGRNLKHLHIKFEVPPSVDFSLNTALESFRLEHAITFSKNSNLNAPGSFWHFRILSTLPEVLSHIRSQSLQVLALGVSGRLRYDPFPAHVQELASALQLPSFARLHRLNFHVPRDPYTSDSGLVDTFSTTILEKLPVAVASCANFTDALE
ncbi:hypothetical protein C8R43DRAFT_81074 [Mycena crocata]|nr:hypothetical protein C8R43DRAFT_81074 [Mycena crocata]